MINLLVALAVPAVRIVVPAVASYLAHRAADKAMRQALPPGRRPDSIDGPAPSYDDAVKKG